MKAKPWSSEPPTEPGWYWWQKDGTKRAVQVLAHQPDSDGPAELGFRLSWGGSSSWFRAKTAGGQWLPLEVPE